MKKSKILYSITSYLLIFLFTYTAVSKLIDHETFLSAMLQSPIIRRQAIVLSWAIPVFELVIVVMLLTERYKKTGLIFSLLLMTVFTLYITYMILFIPHLPCSCGGVLKELSWSNHILFNCVFIMFIFVALLLNSKHKLFIAINRTNRKPV